MTMLKEFFKLNLNQFNRRIKKVNSCKKNVSDNSKIHKTQLND